VVEKHRAVALIGAREGVKLYESQGKRDLSASAAITYFYEPFLEASGNATSLKFDKKKDAIIRTRWIEGETLRQLRLGLSYRQIAALITALARGDVLPATAGVELPPNVIFPVGYTISMKRVFELARQALDRHPMLEAQALRVLWMSRYEEAWAHLQPQMRKGNPRSIEVGMRVAARAAKLAGLDMPVKVAMTHEEGNGIPLEALRALMNRADVEPIDVRPAQEGGRLLTNRKPHEDS
jgi:hypothetical protein